MSLLASYLSNPVVQRGLSAAQAFAGVPAAPSAPTQAETQRQQAETQRQQAEMLRQRAFQAALARPDMPIPPEFSTGSALGDEQERLRARYALMRDAGRSAVAERARAQGRSVTYDQSGNPVIGDVNPAQAIGQYAVRPSGLMQSQVVDLPQGGRAVYDREGRLVGTNLSGISDLDATDRAAFNSGQGTVAEQARLRSAMEEGVRKAMQAPVAAAAATAPVAALVAAPVAAAPVAAPVATVPAPRQTPAANEFRLEEDLAALAEAERLAPAATQSVTPQEALAQAQQFLQEEPARIAEETSRKGDKEYRDQIAKTTQELAQARIQKDVSKVRQLSAKLNNLLVNTPGKVAEQQMARFGALGMGVGLPSNIGGTTATPAELATSAQEAPPEPSRINQAPQLSRQVLFDATRRGVMLPRTADQAFAATPDSQTATPRPDLFSVMRRGVPLPPPSQTQQAAPSVSPTAAPTVSILPQGEPSPANYPLTEEGVRQFQADMAVWQRNQLATRRMAALARRANEPTFGL